MKKINPNFTALKADFLSSHRIPIGEIGTCSIGRPYNTITSCYDCPKFMPVADLSEGLINPTYH